MRIALCQQNTITGNVARNLRGCLDLLAQARHAGAQLAIYPELTLTGYPPRDLLEYPGFVAEALDAQAQVRAQVDSSGVSAIVGNIAHNVHGGKKALMNVAVLLRPGLDPVIVPKKLLPNYDVFDEHRYFQPAPPDSGVGVVDVAGHKIGLSICEDIWNDNEFWKVDRRYEFDPIEQLRNAGAEIIINISASPFVVGKPALRLEMLRHTARRWQRPVVFVNQVGGCDHVVFDGGSCAVSASGELLAGCGWFEEKIVVADVTAGPLTAAAPNPADDLAMIHSALTLGLRDYLRKTGFEQVVFGNSGGIDSAVVGALCAEALGADRVISVSMPGPFTSSETRADSAEIALRLGLRHLEIPIVAPFEALRTLLDGPTAQPLQVLFDNQLGNVHKIANENLQARLRGNILMWISNAIASPRTLLISTGNKSELAVGYCTLYGDMAGGLALISDVPKTMVYELAALLNRRMGDVIPGSIIARAPSAELAPNQKDTDSLPPYEILDEIIRLYVEEKLGANDIVAAGAADSHTVGRVLRMIDGNEYKRQQAAIGVKVTSKAFGFGRRMPVARG